MVPKFWVTDNVALDLHATVTDRATCGEDTVDSVGGAWTADVISIASSCAIMCMDNRCNINCELHVNGTRLSRRKPGAAREREGEEEPGEEREKRQEGGEGGEEARIPPQNTHSRDCTASCDNSVPLVWSRWLVIN